MSAAKTISVLHVPTGKPPKLVEIEASLESYQALVGGYIEHIHPFEDSEVVLVCNEEGKLIPLPPNRALRDKHDPARVLDVVSGDFFLAYAPADADEITSLPDKLVTKYTEKFRVPELIMRSGNNLVVIPLDDSPTDE